LPREKQRIRRVPRTTLLIIHRILPRKKPRKISIGSGDVLPAPLRPPRTGEKKIRMIAIENSEVFIVFRIILDKSRMLTG
jgi:hypothetical protein